jgi:hypothetical protein
MKYVLVVTSEIQEALLQWVSLSVKGVTVSILLGKIKENNHVCQKNITALEVDGVDDRQDMVKKK